MWRKLHIAADSVTYELICADLSLSGTTDARALPTLINETHRKIREASADGAYDTRYRHDALLRKQIKPLIPPRGRAQYWSDRYHERHHAVANQRLSSSNDVWKKKVGYHRRSVAETAMFRFKTIMGDHLGLVDNYSKELLFCKKSLPTFCFFRKNRMPRLMLSDDQYERISPFLPGKAS